MSKRAEATCATCKHWISRDPSLDGGRDLLGTCQKPRDYKIEFQSAYRAAGYQEDKLLANMRDRMRKEGFFLQVHGKFDGEARAYLRTGPMEFCSKHESKVVGPVQSSLTASGAGAAG